MSPRLRAALYAQAGAVFSLHLCLYAGDRPTAGRSRFATLLPGDAAVSPSNGDHAGTQRADPPPPRNGPKHRGAGRSRSATGPPRQSRSTRQFFCAEVLEKEGSEPHTEAPRAPASGGIPPFADMVASNEVASLLAIRIATIGRLNLTHSSPDSPDGLGRQDPRARKCWRNCRLLVSPV